MQVRAAYQENGDVQVHLRNTGLDPVTATVEDNSYKTGNATRKIGAGEEASIPLNLKGSHGWYDFTVKVNGAESRFAGRVETGRPSFSDPLMGGVV